MRAVVQACKHCRNVDQRVRRQTGIPTALDFRARGWVDLFLVVGKLWAIVIIDEATKELALELMEDTTAEAAWEAYVDRWASLRGHFGELLSDPGGEFIGKDFIVRAEMSKVFKKVTAAKSSESHGGVERPIRTVRWTVDRLKDELRERKEEWCAKKWRRALHSIENGIRNEVLVGSSSASIRATGRVSSMHLNALSDSAVSGAEVPTGSLLDVQRRAQEAFVRVVWDRKLRAILAERAAPASVEHVFKVGDVVEFCRDTERGASGGVRGRRWHGPAVVVGEASQELRYYRIDHGGVDYRVHPRDVREAGSGASVEHVPARRQEVVSKVVPTGVPRRGPGRAPRGKEWNHEVGEWQEAAPVVRAPEGVSPAAAVVESAPLVQPGQVDAAQAAGVDVQDQVDGDSCVNTAALLGAARFELSPFQEGDSASSGSHYDFEVFNRHHRDAGASLHLCYFTEVAKRLRSAVESTELADPIGPETLCLSVGSSVCFFSVGSMDVYGYQWEDVSPELQQKAYDRALTDYDGTGSWERGSELTAKQLKDMGIKPLNGRSVEKAKMDGGVLVGRLRWTPKGFQESGPSAWNKENTVSPTVHRTSMRVAEVVTAAEPEGPDEDDYVAFEADWSEAFFHSALFEEMPLVHQKENLFIEVPWFDDGPMNDCAQEARERGEKIYRRLLREVPGTKRAPQSWFLTIANELITACGAVQSKMDPCLFWFSDGSSARCGYGGIHVDDMKGRAKRRTVKFLEDQLSTKYKIKFKIIEVGDTCEHVGERYEECTDCVLIDQEQYTDIQLHEINLAQGRWKNRDAQCTADEIAKFGTAQGQAAWVTLRTRPELQYETSVAASRKAHLHVRDVIRLNKTIKIIKDARWRYKFRLPKLKAAKDLGFRVVCVPDAGEGEQHQEDWSKAQGGRIVGIMVNGTLGDPGEMGVVDIRSTKLKRVTHSSFDAECVNTIECVDVALGVVELIHEWQHGVQPSRIDVARHWAATHEWPDVMIPVPMEVHTDARDVTDAVESLRIRPGMAKRRRLDIADLKELRDLGHLRRLLHVSGKSIHSDPMTKSRVLTKQTMARLTDLLRSSFYEPIVA